MDKAVDDFAFHTVVMHGPPYQGRLKMLIIGRCILWNILYTYVCVCVCVCDFIFQWSKYIWLFTKFCFHFVNSRVQYQISLLVDLFQRCILKLTS